MKCSAGFLVVCLLVTVPAARADFLITSTRVRITDGPYAGDDQITFRTQNTGTGQTAGTSKLLAMDVAMTAYPCINLFGTPSGHMFIHTYDADGSGLNDDADFADQGGNLMPLSYIRAGSRTSFVLVATTPPFNSPDDIVSVHSAKPYTDGQWVSQFEVVGAVNLTGGGINATQPIPFAAAVVPAGEFVLVNGLFGAEAGDLIPFQTLLPVSPPDCPEPSAIGILVGFASAWRRKR